MAPYKPAAGVTDVKSWDWLWEPLRAYWARKRWERCHYEALTRHYGHGEQIRDPDEDRWRPIGQIYWPDAEDLREQARRLVRDNPYACNIINVYRNYVVGTGMRHEIEPIERVDELVADDRRDSRRRYIAQLWQEFLDVNDWDKGQRRDWEYCVRTWRDGECFVRVFRAAQWPPRIHFVDPEQVAPDPRTGEPSEGIETAPDNVEEVLAYHLVYKDRHERVEADRMVHTKINVDSNVKRGVSLFAPIIESLKRFHSWLEVELIHRKLASSIVLVRKHSQSYPGAVGPYAQGLEDSRRPLKLMPGTVLDVQGFDLEFLSPQTHFADASLLGRMILLSIAAGAGLPEFMLSADASNANYASTLVAEGPAVRHFAAWQRFFMGQWQKLFALVMREAEWLGLLERGESRHWRLQITPPPLAVRNRHEEAQADALYYDRGALSARELARRDHADPERMVRERREEDRWRRAEAPA